jgi:hypothetical protein
MQCSMPSSSQCPVRELKDPLEGLTITRTSRATDATGSSVRLRRAVGRRYTLHRPPLALAEVTVGAARALGGPRPF